MCVCVLSKEINCEHIYMCVYNYIQYIYIYIYIYDVPTLTCMCDRKKKIHVYFKSNEIFLKKLRKNLKNNLIYK